MKNDKVSKMFSKCCGRNPFGPSMLLAFCFTLITLAFPTGGPAEVAPAGANMGGHTALPVTEGMHAVRGGSWEAMPAGARPAYIGIHGGTVPVSLLTSRGGVTMVALVGETGSDFLRVLRGSNASSRVEMEQNLVASTQTRASDAPTLPVKGEPGPMPVETAPQASPNATMLVAATSTGSVPVIYAAGRSFERMDIAASQWTPFGLEDEVVKTDGKGHTKEKAKVKKAKNKTRKQTASTQRPTNKRQERARSHRTLHNEGGPVSITAPSFFINA